MSDPQKIVWNVHICCKICKQQVLRTVAKVQGVDSVAVDEDSKLTVIGNPDPVRITKALRKRRKAELLSVGPAKEPAKTKPEPQKPKDPPKPEASKDPPNQDPPMVLMVPECNYCTVENPNSCVIC